MAAARRVEVGGCWGGWGWVRRVPPPRDRGRKGSAGDGNDGGAELRAPRDGMPLSLASRALSSHPRPSLPWSSAATSAHLRRALRSASSNSCCDTSCRENGPRARGYQQWNLTSRPIYRSRKILRENSPYDSRTVLRERPVTINILATDRRRLPPPPRQLPFLRGQTQRQRRMSWLRHKRRLVSRGGVSGAGRVANCPGTAHCTSPIKTAAPYPFASPVEAAAPRPCNLAAPKDLAVWLPKLPKGRQTTKFSRMRARQLLYQDRRCEEALVQRTMRRRRSRATRSRRPLMPPVYAARTRRPLASPSRVALSRRPLAQSPRPARLRRPLAT